MDYRSPLALGWTLLVIVSRQGAYLKAAIYRTFQGPIEVCEVDEPVAVADGVVIAVRATGVCRSDWHGWMGHDADVRLPHVPGHELAGVVHSVGRGVQKWRAGDLVTVPFSVGCGSCEQCVKGNPQICDRYFQPGFTAWGSFAELVGIRHADFNLVALPENLDFVSAASLGCRFITSFRAIVDQAGVLPGEWVAVHGCGGVGLSSVMIATARGASVIAIDVREDALAKAGELGATECLNAGELSGIPSAIREITGGGAHVSVDALGSRKTCIDSVSCLRKQGRHIQIGLLMADQAEPPIPMHLVISNELTLIGSHGMQASRYGELFVMISTGKLEPQKLIGKTISLEEVPEALPAMGRFKSTGVSVIDRF